MITGKAPVQRSKPTRMKTRTISLILFIVVLSACSDNPPPPPAKMSIAVVSDIHYMAPSLLVNGAENGEAFQNYLNADPKLIQYSDAITHQLVEELLTSRPDLLLIPGDLTKDGERVSHQALIALLQQLRSNGTKVLVVPGNHDINNPEAAAYDGDNATPTTSISATEFADLYKDFGYETALYRDPNSLSYVSAVPYPNLWILAIDDCKYAENTDIAIIGGNIKDATRQWILDRLAEAKQKGIRVFAMMHHNLVEHYEGQNQLDPEYVTDNWETNSHAFMDAGLELIFTGHYHANDVTAYSYNNKTLYDVETGSQVNPPLPYRTMALTEKMLSVQSKHITNINASLPGGADLVTYSRAFFSAHLDGAFSYLLTQEPFSLSEADAAAAAPYFRDAYMAHFAGDEVMPNAVATYLNDLTSLSPIAAMALATLWTDINTPDNDYTITLN